MTKAQANASNERSSITLMEFRMSRFVSTLEQALSYQHEGVVARFMLQFAIPRKEAEEIFLETKRWLWLNAKHLDDLNQGSPNVPKSL